MLSKGKRLWLMATSATLSFASTPGLAKPAWDASLGAGVLYAPDYLGSDDYETRVWPTINVSYGDRFYFNIRDGLGWNLIRHGNWKLSPFIGYIPGATMMRILNAWTRLMAARSPACALLTITTHGRTAQPSNLPSPAMSMAIRWCLRHDGGTSSAINGLPPWGRT